jgi:hypothetical protein
MKKLIALAILGVIGYVIYINARPPENVRIQNTISKRWFSPVSNITPGLVDVVDHFEVDPDLTTRVYVTRHYEMLGDNQMGFLHEVVFLVHSETGSAYPGITFILDSKIVAATTQGDPKGAITIYR